MLDTKTSIEAFARNVRLVKMQANGLTHEESLLQLPFRGNCLNWVLGHLAANRDSVLKLLGEPTIFAQATRYKTDSPPVTEAGTDALPLQELIDGLDRTQERIAAAMAQMDEAAWSREVIANDRKATIADRVFFLYFHETYHVGQTELFRQLAGKDDKII